jgi:uncharacterized protein YecE (DUF72 family)
VSRLWVGTSGYAYVGWRGRFYPAGLSPRSELAYASRIFSSIEINRSFYALLSPAMCTAWRDAVPPGFVFSLKGSRFITHNKKLRDTEQALANFFASGPLALGDMLGPIVWQLSANMAFDAGRLESFLANLPTSTAQAAQLASRHDERVKQAHLQVDQDRPLRHVLEPRHPSFASPECAALLRRYRVALAVSDSPSWHYIEEPTADFMYIRLHGSQQLYASQYTDAELAHWAGHVRAFLRGRMPADARRISDTQAAGPQDVFVYFDNDAQAFAAQDAQRLAKLLSRNAAASRPRSVRERHSPVPAKPRIGASKSARAGRRSGHAS